MSALLRKFATFVAVMLACAASTLPACGTMGGGGMKYLVDVPPSAGQSI
jgi:predicted small secreted protein